MHPEWRIDPEASRVPLEDWEQADSWLFFRPPLIVDAKGEPLRKVVPRLPLDPRLDRRLFEAIEDMPGQLHIAFLAVELKDAVLRSERDGQA